CFDIDRCRRSAIDYHSNDNTGSGLTRRANGNDTRNAAVSQKPISMTNRSYSSRNRATRQHSLTKRSFGKDNFFTGNQISGYGTKRNFCFTNINFRNKIINQRLKIIERKYGWPEKGLSKPVAIHDICFRLIKETFVLPRKRHAD